MTTSYDAIVIGSGQAGPFLAVKLAKAGMRTVLIEREHLGGTCVNDGCIPTKTLVASARAAHVARRAADYGVRIGGAVGVDMKAVKARKDRVVADSIGGLAKMDRADPGPDACCGATRASSPRTRSRSAARGWRRRGSSSTSAAGRCCPTGTASPSVPVLTNVSMMALDSLPEHLIVAGGSYIGLEFAQMYRRFGARVTVIEYGDRLIAREDR